MSWHEYQEALLLRRGSAPYYALIMAAMMGADSFNAERLRYAWPDLWDEVQARWNAPGGLLDGEPEPNKVAWERYRG